MKVYQYIKPEVFFNAFTREGFWVKASHPEEFNDLFECTGGVYGTPTEEFVKEFLEQRPDLCSMAMWNGKGAAEYVGEWLWRAFYDRKFLGQGHRISCFVESSAVDDDVGADARMWSHYADCAHGLRLCFETDGLPYEFEKVNYKYVAPKLNLKDVPNIAALKGFIEECIHTKQKSWSQENEVRVVFRGPNDDVKWHEDLKMYRWMMPYANIREIVMGEQAYKDHARREEIRGHLIKHCGGRMADLKIRAMKRSFNTYGYSYSDVSIIPSLESDE